MIEDCGSAAPQVGGRASGVDRKGCLPNGRDRRHQERSAWCWLALWSDQRERRSSPVPARQGRDAPAFPFSFALPPKQRKKAREEERKSGQQVEDFFENQGPLERGSRQFFDASPHNLPPVCLLWPSEMAICGIYRQDHAAQQYNAGGFHADDLLCAHGFILTSSEDLKNLFVARVAVSR
ncbi:hypothetical protein GDI3867 (plasmid) [Gluconacetobacter diazotrophicus PA1 5]|uniref:Uncharacterized protein n=1 Tax=Gluconacetobacter diazotrophicus (strain ATCC 49037 / DSM 5601 / CCUG 37298 / CIP 103539 / LMG 7603 / PAl5) TaxID=272568 RepID=A9HST6_GLUDA|nr:hypothetical protein GDI3867 [Gluconacetobacter diazotrophicus PA1 5]